MPGMTNELTTGTDGVTPIGRNEMKWLAIGVIVSLAVHGVFILKGFGEPDAARLAREAIVWNQVGQMPSIGYTPRTSPLYIHWLAKMLALGLPPLKLPMVMNWTSLVLGSLSLVPLYLIWRRLASPAAAAAGLVIYSFMPAFWLGNIYGMPLIPAFFCFACSLVLFGRWLGFGWQPPRPQYMWQGGWLLGSALLAVAGVMLKADIVLCYGTFFLLALWARPIRFRNLTAALAIPLAAVMLTTSYTRAISDRIYSTETWSNRWGFTSDVFLYENIRVPAVAAGWVLTGVIVLAVIYCLLRRRHAGVLWLVLFWAVPGILFWCSKTGNSARHMMVSYAPLALLAGVVLVCILPNWRKWVPALAVILALNYFVTIKRDMSDTVRPASNIFAAQGEIQKMLDKWHGAGREFALLPDKQKVLYGEDNSTYAVWEVLARARNFRQEKDGPGYAVTGHDGCEQIVRVIYHLRSEPPIVPQEGWSTWYWWDYTVPVKMEAPPSSRALLSPEPSPV
jgi:hypothetical protein